MKKATLLYSAMLPLATGLVARFVPSSVFDGGLHTPAHSHGVEKQHLISISNACGELSETAIGSLNGSAVFDACNPDVISISANGFPSSTSDVQYMVQREVCGNGELIVRVLSVSDGNAGLEIRADNEPGSIKVGRKPNCRTRRANKPIPNRQWLINTCS